MNNFLQVFSVIFSATLTSLAIPNEIFLLGSPFIALFALIPLYFAIKNATSFKNSALLMALHTFLVHILSSFWLAFFKDFALFTLGASALGTAFVGSFFGFFLYLPFQKKSSLSENAYNKFFSLPARIFWFTGVYILYEWTKSSTLSFLAYPWGTLSSCAFSWRLLMQIADITGTYGVSFLFALCSAVIAEGFILLHAPVSVALQKNAFAMYKKCVNTFVVLLALSFCYGAFQYAKVRTPDKELNTIMVQQNENPWEAKSDMASIERSQKISEEKINEARDSGKDVHLVVWSEGVLRHAFPQAESHYSFYPASESLTSFIKRMNVPFIIGGAYLENQQKHLFHNSALLFDKEGNFRAHNGKTHLVPFAEVVPFTEFPFVQKILNKAIGISAGWTPGNQFVLFDIPCQWSSIKKKESAKIVSLKNTKDEQEQIENAPPIARSSTPICFEDAFPNDVIRPLFLLGSEIFINLTDDSWSRTKSAEFQHFVIASYRAIEYRTTLLRSTNAGVTAVIDPSGKVVASLPLFEEASLFCSVPIYKKEMTIYAMLGDWFPALIFFCCLLYFLKNAFYYIFEFARNLKKSLVKKLTD